MIEVDRCIWKNVLDNPESTSGIDMQKQEGLACKACPGTPENALLKDCQRFVIRREGKVLRINDLKELPVEPDTK